MNPEQELAELEALLDQILAGIQELLQSGETLSDEFQGQLADEIEQTTQRIDQLTQEISNNNIPPEAQLGAPPSSGAQLMWILAGQNPEAFENYLRTYPDPELNALAQNPTEMQRNINFLQQMMPNLPQPSQDGIQHADLNSSNIYGFKYDPKSQKLLVRFQGGSVYKYDGVPENIFNVFQAGAIPARTRGQNSYGRWWQGKNPSLGAAFHALIRQGPYPYRRMR